MLDNEATAKPRTKLRSIIPWLAAVILAALAAGSFLFYRMGLKAGATATPVAAAQRVTMVNGVPVVTIDGAMQQQSGIRTEALSSISHQTETSAYGTVVDLNPLIELRSRLVSMRGEVDTAKAAAFAAGQQVERYRTLYREQHAVSLQDLQAKEAGYLSDQAKLTAAQRNSDNIRTQARQQFGEPVAGWALDSESPDFERLANRQDVLVRVTFPPGDQIQAPTDIELDVNDKRVPAHLVSASAESDPTIQGRAFIYRAATSIPDETNLVAHLPITTQATQGIIIPGAAIVWHAGQPWAYVQIAPDRFARRPVDRSAPTSDGFFVADGFKPDDRVVISGAQLLLSEELRPTPGAGCKDPECD